METSVGRGISPGPDVGLATMYTAMGGDLMEDPNAPGKLAVALTEEGEEERKPSHESTAARQIVL